MNRAGWIASFAPLAAATALLLSMQSPAPALQDEATAAKRGMELPVPAREATWMPGDYELVADEGAVVLSAQSASNSVRARTVAVDAHMRLGPVAPETLTVGFELLSVVPAHTDPGHKDDFLERLRTAFGLAMHDDLRLALRCIDAASVPGLPLRRSQWTGTLSLDHAADNVRCELWQGSWSEDRFRLQGTLELSGERLGLPAPRTLGLWPGATSITLGFDLSFRLRK